MGTKKLTNTFAGIFERNDWGSEESVSGPGSTQRQTAAIRRALPGLIKTYGIKSILDIPCGDYAWWPLMTFEGPVEYIGADIVPELIEQNKKNHHGVDFRVIDLVHDELPEVDMIFVRDCLGHLSNLNVEKALANIKSSNIKYLMSTTFYDPKWSLDADIEDGGWRPINLIKQFGLGEPLVMVSEELNDASGAYHDKSMGLWRIDR